MPDAHSTFEPFILFEIAGATYGLRSREVGQIEMIEHITPVPDGPPFVEGIVFSRGQVIPAVNLRLRFGFERIPFTLRTRLIVTQRGERTVGFIVDSAREFAHIDPESILPPPEEISGLNGRYLEGIARKDARLILILDIDEVLRLSGTDTLPEGPDRERAVQDSVA